jgi:pseudomonalisin/xanthomonalisin
MAGRSVPRLTSAQFLERHAPTQAQADAVAAHLRAAGFTNVTIAPNRMLVSADGTVGTAKAAFNVEMKHFNVDGRNAYANVPDAQVPAHLAGLVVSVHGLQNVHQYHTMHRIATATPDSVTAAAAVGHNPTEFSAIYNATALPPATNSTVAIISEGDITQTLTDLSSFATGAGYPQPAVTKVVVGAAGTDTSGIVEWNMDSQSSLSTAGGQVKGMIFYVSTTLDDAPLTEAYNRAVSDNIAQSINVSLGECETAAKNSGIMASNDAIFQVAVAQGQMFSVSSGDSGSYQCGSAHGGQSYPAVSPYVMAIGGTKVKTTNQTTWAGESVWACTSSLTCKLTGGTGGGSSINEPAPAWQISSGVLKGATTRGIPDIAFDGDPSSGALVLVGTKTQQVGGTSLSAPIWAGFWARIQSQHANTLIFPANAIYGYAAANSAKMFHDVTTGKNGGYAAAVGWDYASGYGSINVGKFAAFVNTHPGF